jgi:hypothetical protein
MSQSTRPLGLRSTPEFALPQFSNWKTELRVVTTNDGILVAIVGGDANQ